MIDDLSVLNARTVVLAALCGSTIAKLRDRGVLSSSDAEGIFLYVEEMIPNDIMIHATQLMRAARAAVTAKQ